MNGVIFAGGGGRRIGGEKPFADLAGRPLISHVVDLMQPQVDALYLSVRHDQHALSEFGLPMINDAVPDDGTGGVAVALLSALDAVCAGDDICLSVPCDTPFLPGDLATTLVRTMRQTDASAVVMRAGGRLQPTVGLWTNTARAALRGCLEKGERRMHSICNDVGVVELDASLVPWPDWRLMNINTPSDLIEANN